MRVFLPAKLRHLGCPAAFGGPRCGAKTWNITTKYFRLQLEYWGKWTVRVTMCNIPIQLNGGVLAAYLCKYGSVLAVTPLKSSDGTAHSDNILTVCPDREGFQAIPHIISNEQQLMMVVVKCRRPLCLACKQLGHVTRTCPQKTATIKTYDTTTSTTTSTRTTTSVTSTAAREPEVHPDNQEKGWALVT